MAKKSTAQIQPDPNAKLFLFGQPRLLARGKEFALDTTKATLFMVYLAANPNKARFRSREDLKEFVSGTIKTYENRAKELIWYSHVPPIEIMRGENALRWNIPSDVDDMRSALRKQDFETADAIFQKEFMLGFSIVLKDQLGLLEIEQELREGWRAFGIRDAQDRYAAMRLEEAATVWDKVIASYRTEEIPEEVIADALDTAAGLGRVDTAELWYKRYCQNLEANDQEPLEEIQKQFERIKKGEFERSNIGVLPRLQQKLVGRNNDFEALDDLMHSTEKRLVTVVGLGGVGKTALVTWYAHRASSSKRFADGVVSVSLRGITSEDALIHNLAHAFGISFWDSKNRREELIRTMSQKKCLLVLDNAEDAQNAKLADLLEETLAKGEIKLLVTSRQAIRQPFPPRLVKHEYLYELRGLSEEDGHEFYQSMHPQTPLTRQEYAHLHKRTGGLPLAIGLLTLENTNKNAENLEQQFEQHLQSMLSTLEKQERQMFMGLAVFPSDFHADAATAVCGAEAQQLNLYARKFMLERRLGGRYEMHPALREHALRQLDGTNTKPKHAQYYLQHSKDLLNDLQRNPFQTVTEANNMRQAWQWLAQQPKHTQEKLEQAQLATLIGEHTWAAQMTQAVLDEPKATPNQRAEAFLVVAEQQTNASVQAASESIASALALATDPALRVKAQYQKAVLLLDTQPQESVTLLTQAAKHATMPTTTAIQRILARLEAERGEIAAANQRLVEALKQCPPNEYPLEAGKLLISLGITQQHMGDLGQAEESLCQAIALYEAIGASFMSQPIAMAKGMLANVFERQEKFEQARSMYLEAKATFVVHNDQKNTINILAKLGRMAKLQNHWNEAREFFTEGLALAKDLKSKGQTLELLLDLADTFRFLGIAEAFPMALGLVRFVKREMTTDSVRSLNVFLEGVLDGTGLPHHWGETLDEVVENVLGALPRLKLS